MSGQTLLRRPRARIHRRFRSARTVPNRLPLARVRADDSSDEGVQVVTIPLQVDALGRGWLLAEANARPAFYPGANGPWHKAAAAVRANVVQDMLNAACAERALVRAYPRVGRVRGQVAVAVFAIRSKFEHRVCRARGSARRQYTARYRVDGTARQSPTHVPVILALVSLAPRRPRPPARAVPLAG